jgi:hypothetical protein
MYVDTSFYRFHIYHPECKQTTSACNTVAHLMGKEPFMCLCKERFYSNINKSLNIRKRPRHMTLESPVTDWAFSGVRVAQSFIFCVVYFIDHYFRSSITISDYHFGIFKQSIKCLLFENLALNKNNSFLQLFQLVFICFKVWDHKLL